MSILDKVKQALRKKSTTLDDEIVDIIKACLADLRRVGIDAPDISTNEDVTNPLVRRAIILYAKANFGYDEESEKYQKAYDNLICGLSLEGSDDAVE